MRRSLTPFQRHKAIVEFVEAHATAKVDELAERFAVSEGTIRNDLNSLEARGVLMRVRGGAVARSQAHLLAGSGTAGARPGSPDRIAKWAAELVGDGDVVLLDAGEVTMAMAHHLRERRDLTVVTPHLDAARLLAGDPGKTVILTGGLLRPDGSAVTGELGLQALKTLRIKTAFLACAALSPEAGLMESDPQEAKFKRQAVASATRVVALQAIATLDHVGLLPVVPLDELDHLVTDGKPSRTAMARLRAADVTVTVCGTDVVQTLAPSAEPGRRYRIGFANLTEALLFPVDVRRSLERAAAEQETIELVIADNAMDGATALRVAEELLDEGVDLLVEYQIDAGANLRIMNLVQSRSVPVIAVDIPMVGATYFGVDHYRAGRMAGAALGHWIEEHWRGRLDTLFVLEEKRAGALPAARIEGQIDALGEVLGHDRRHRIVRLDSGNVREVSRASLLAALERLPAGKRLAVAAFNDDVALGALDAVRAAGREEEAAIVGQGADRRLREVLRSGTRAVIGATAFHPEAYGPPILDLAQKLLSGQAVPPAVYIEHTFITPANVDLHYPDEAG